MFIAVVLLPSTDAIHWWAPALALYQLAAGGTIGGVLAWLGAHGLRRAALPATGLYPLATMALCLAAYAIAQGAGTSGLLATYVAGLVLDNARLPHRGDTLSFIEAWAGWHRSGCSYCSACTPLPAGSSAHCSPH